MQSTPKIPPRMYPRPPPSSLLPTILGIARLLKYASIGSATATAVYMLFVLPRLNLVYELRTALQKQRERLLVSAHGQLLELDAARSSERVAATAHVNAPYARHIRKALQDAPEHRLSTTDLLEQLGNELPWIRSNEPHYMAIVGRTIHQSEDLKFIDEDDQQVVTLTRPAQEPQHTAERPSERPSWEAVSQSVSSLRRTRNSASTLQSLVDLSSYISSQSYMHVQSYLMYRPAAQTSSTTALPEDEIRREIRALKSLLLSRRSFLPRFGQRQSTPSGAV
ncbi:hypothetical protein BKA62DRAFT_689856 [Auriculariales sp. MPI-PUGE-AT-0066]|nr:hypothetical protein BKA62DRAFT_689856 [Auriculariales sp. MPI-PUGE-AT-0066]